jgi:hypothetical protein
VCCLARFAKHHLFTTHLQPFPSTASTATFIETIIVSHASQVFVILSKYSSPDIGDITSMFKGRHTGLAVFWCNSEMHDIERASMGDPVIHFFRSGLDMLIERVLCHMICMTTQRSEIRLSYVIYHRSRAYHLRKSNMLHTSLQPPPFIAIYIHISLHSLSPSSCPLLFP